MKRIVFVLVCFIRFVSYAQNIPADSLDYYRKSAHRLLIDNRVGEAIELYKNLALSGDALSGYQLCEFYSQGKGVQKDPVEAEKWRAMAENIITEAYQKAHPKNCPNDKIQQSSEKELTLDNVLNESGRLIELGAKEKNISYALGIGGGAVGGTLLIIGTAKNEQALTIVGGVIAGGFGIAALVLDIIGNKNIKRGGELMRRVQISGTGISVKF